MALGYKYLKLDLKRQNDDNLKRLRTDVNPTSYERFEIWSKYFHIGGSFSYINQINHEGERLLNSILVSSNSRPAKYVPRFSPPALTTTVLVLTLLT